VCDGPQERVVAVRSKVAEEGRTSGAGESLEATLTRLFLLVGEHLLGPLNALAQAVLKLLVALPLLDVLSDSGADDLRDRLVVDSGNRLQLFGLLGRQADGHGLGGLHAPDYATDALRLSTTR